MSDEIEQEEKKKLLEDVRSRLAFIYELERYIYRLPDKPWSFDQVFSKKDTARLWLMDQGLSEKIAAKSLKNGSHVKLHRVDRLHGRPAVYPDAMGRTTLNLCMPSKIQPDPTKDWPTIRRIMLALCGADPSATPAAPEELDRQPEKVQASFTWLMNWLAAAYQQPNRLWGTAVVVHGTQGAGKTSMGKILGFLVGDWIEIGQSHLDATFNGTWAGRLVVVANEVVDHDKLLNASENKLKAAITDGTVVVNEKNIRAFEMENRSTWWITSNDSRPVRIPTDDRRFTLLGTWHPLPTGYKEMLNGFWGPQSLGNADELAGFAAALQAWEVNEALARTPLDNDDRRKVQESSKPSAEAFFDELDTFGVAAVVEEVNLAITRPEDQLTVAPSKEHEGHAWYPASWCHRLYAAWCKATGHMAAKRATVKGYVCGPRRGDEKRFNEGRYWRWEKKKPSLTLVPQISVTTTTAGPAMPSTQHPINRSITYGS